MYDSRAREVLSQPVIVRINTLTADGFPHSVPVWFMLDGDDLIIFSDSKSQKVANARANPKGSLAIGGDPVGSPCYLIEGTITLEADPDHAVTARITRHYDPAGADQWLTAWKDSDHVILRLKPTRVVKVA